MSKWSNLLLDVNYMKRDAADAVKVVIRDVTQFGCFFEEQLKDAVMARYNLDKLLLTESQLVSKWSRQCLVHTYASNSVAFRGTEDECIKFINKKENQNAPLEMYWPLPDEMYWSWSEYFRNIELSTGLEVSM